MKDKIAIRYIITNKDMQGNKKQIILFYGYSEF